MLYRSNKLMYDRQTFTLWENLTGEPVAGRMAVSGYRLKILPMTLTSWGEWKSSHPDTRVLHLEESYGKKWNYRYEPGIADRARKGVSFPVWNKSKILKDKEEVYGVKVSDHPKAYVIKTILEQRIVNDEINSVPIVVIAEDKSEAVRIYHRKSMLFSFVSGHITNDSGISCKALEDALVCGDQRLERIPGYVSWWFAWSGFFPHTELYR